MSKHTLLMLIGCLVPLLLIFFAPVLGLGGNIPLLIFIAAMFLCHLLMPMHLGGHRHQGGDAGSVKRGGNEPPSH